jgi:hypothetical protein
MGTDITRGLKGYFSAIWAVPYLALADDSAEYEEAMRSFSVGFWNAFDKFYCALSQLPGHAVDRAEKSQKFPCFWEFVWRGF